MNCGRSSDDLNVEMSLSILRLETSDSTKPARKIPKQQYRWDKTKCEWTMSLQALILIVNNYNRALCNC